MNDDADPVLVREPEAEHKFIAAGDGTDRRQIDRNDFVVVGPRSHPAHIPGSGDAVAALRGIASTRARFVSRRDRSGTDVLEHRLWREAGIDPPSIMASRCRRRGLVQQPRGIKKASFKSSSNAFRLPSVRPRSEVVMSRVQRVSARTRPLPNGCIKRFYMTFR